MSTTQTWVRAELVAATNATVGAQLMIPADGLEFHGDDLVFQRQGEVVYVAEAGQLRSVTWLDKEPNPGFARRKAQWPNFGTRWNEAQRDELRAQLAEGQSWTEIAQAHGRSRSGVQQEAVKQGWVDAETLQVRPEVSAYPAADSGAESDFGDERSGET